MDRRMFLRSALGAAGMVVVGSCSRNRVAEDPKSEPVRLQPAGELPPVPRPPLRLPGGDFGFPSPFTYMVGPGYLRMSLIYDTLLWADGTGTLLPWLAAEEPQRSEDNLTYTFRLRDVQWHDGLPLTADDVTFTVRYFLENAARLSPQVLLQPRDIAEARAVDARTVEVRLERPVVTFREWAAQLLPIAPRHVWSSIADPTSVQDPKVLVGSGPYRLQSYTRGEGSYLYTANDGFFLGRPFVKRVELRPVDDELNALLAGEVDAASTAATGATREALAPFRGNPEFRLVEGRPDLVAALYWNLARGGALADVRFRQACAHAIDRRDMVQRLLGGNGHPGNPGFLPPQHPARVEVEQYGYDRALANRLLDEAGYKRTASGTRRGPDGAPLRFRLQATPQLSAATELVVRALDAIGVELRIDPLEPQQSFVTLMRGDYEMAILLYGGIGGDPDYMRQVYSSRSTRRFHSAHGYAAPEFDQLADRQVVTHDEDERRRQLGRMQEIVARDLPFLHLYYPTPVLLFRQGNFDQWALTPATGPFNKQALVTGVASGLEIRAIAEGG